MVHARWGFDAVLKSVGRHGSQPAAVLVRNALASIRRQSQIEKAIAIVDRLVHNAYRLQFKGESMRKRQAKLTPTTVSD